MSSPCGPHSLTQPPGAAATGLRPRVQEALRGPWRAAGWGSGHSPPALSPAVVLQGLGAPCIGATRTHQVLPSWVRAPGPCLLLPDLWGQLSDPTPVHTPDMSVDPGEMLWVTLQGQPGGPSCSRCLGDRMGARGAASGKRQNVLEQAGLQALFLEPEESGCLPACPPAASLSLGWSHFLLAISAPGRAAGLGMWHAGHRSAMPPRAPWARLAHTPPPRRSRNEHMLRPTAGRRSSRSRHSRAPRPTPATALQWPRVGAASPAWEAAGWAGARACLPSSTCWPLGPLTTAVPWLCCALLHLRSVRAGHGGRGPGRLPPPTPCTTLQPSHRAAG